MCCNTLEVEFCRIFAPTVVYLECLITQTCMRQMSYPKNRKYTMSPKILYLKFFILQIVYSKITIFWTLPM